LVETNDDAGWVLAHATQAITPEQIKRLKIIKGA